MYILNTYNLFVDFKYGYQIKEGDYSNDYQRYIEYT